MFELGVAGSVANPGNGQPYQVFGISAIPMLIDEVPDVRLLYSPDDTQIHSIPQDDPRLATVRSSLEAFVEHIDEWIPREIYTHAQDVLNMLDYSQEHSTNVETRSR